MKERLKSFWKYFKDNWSFYNIIWVLFLIIIINGNTMLPVSELEHLTYIVGLGLMVLIMEMRNGYKLIRKQHEALKITRKQFNIE